MINHGHHLSPVITNPCQRQSPVSLSAPVTSHHYPSHRRCRLQIPSSRPISPPPAYAHARPEKEFADRCGRRDDQRRRRTRACGGVCMHGARALRHPSPHSTPSRLSFTLRTFTHTHTHTLARSLARSRARAHTHTHTHGPVGVGMPLTEGSTEAETETTMFTTCPRARKREHADAQAHASASASAHKRKRESRRARARAQTCTSTY